MGTKANAARVMTWRPDLRAHFERLNREWIERWFVVEDADRSAFADPGRGSSSPVVRSSSSWTKPACGAPVP